MSVIDLQRNHTGVQTLVTSLTADELMAGRGSLLKHTDGYMYCFFARNYQNAVSQRRLYMSRSNDDGSTWSAPIEVSSDSWDDEPTVIQHDIADTGSHIAVVFTRNTVLTRVLINKETGAAETPYDALTGSPTGAVFPMLMHVSTGFLVAYIERNNEGTTQQVKFARNTSFTTNSWALTTVNVFPLNEQPLSLYMIRLSNGHLALAAGYRTALTGRNGTESSGMGIGNLPSADVRCDLGVAFSSDEGYTWSSVQKLSNYTGNTAFSLTGYDTVASAALAELSDGNIVVTYQEQTASVLLNQDTVPTIPSYTGFLRNVRYHAGHNCIFYTGDSINPSDGQTNIYGGVFVYNVGTGSITRLFTGSTPALWANTVMAIDISPNGNQLAVGTKTGGLSIIDITDADPANWTISKELRTTSTPSLPVDSIFYIRWADDDVVAFSYGLPSASNTCGGIYKISDNSLTAMLFYGALNTSEIPFVIENGRIVLTYGGRLEAVSLSTGGVLYYSDASGISWDGVVYDSVNLQFIASFNTGIGVYTDSGSAFTLEVSHTASSNPAFAGRTPDGADGLGAIDGKGGLYWGNGRQAWYSFKTRKPGGYRNLGYTNHLGEEANFTSNQYAGQLPGTDWHVFGSIAGNLVFINLNKTGRPRYGVFPYDSVNKVLLTSGVDFYDVCNTIKLGTAASRLQFPSMVTDADDRLYMYFVRADVDATSDAFGPVLGIVEPDVKRLQVRSNIQALINQPIAGKVRIRNTYTSTFDARMRIVFAQCIKARARIVPVNMVSMTSRAAIQNWQSTSIRATYDVQQSGRTCFVRLQFWANTGYNSFKRVEAKARIVKTASCRVTGHFIVPAISLGSLTNFSAASRARHALSVRANISR